MFFKTKNRKIIGALLVLAFLIGSVPMTMVSAAAQAGIITTYKTNNNPNQYVQYSLTGNTLEILGVCSNAEVQYILPFVDGMGGEPVAITPKQSFSITVDLSAYTAAEDMLVILEGLNQSYDFASYPFEDAHLLYTAEGWRFDFDQDNLQNNAAQKSSWMNPADALATESIASAVVKLSESITQSAGSDYEKALLLHHWVTDNIYYDYDYAEDRTTEVSLFAADVLATKRTVCAGYAQLLQALLQAQNIPCIICESEDHAWNEVWADGRWCNVDATWDAWNTYINGEFDYVGGGSMIYFDMADEPFSVDHKITMRSNTAYGSNIPADWAQKEIAQAFAQNLIPYALQGAYAAQITRQDFCTLIMRLMEVENGSDLDGLCAAYDVTMPQAVFSDCSDPAVNAAYAFGIVGGKGNGIFAPNGSITRQEAAAMLYRTAQKLGMKQPTGESRAFADKDACNDWAVSAIDFVSAITDANTNAVVMGGVDATHFSPQSTYTRQQAYCTVLRLYHALAA